MFTNEDLIPAYITTKLEEHRKGRRYASPYSEGCRALLNPLKDSEPYRSKDWRALKERLLQVHEGQQEMFQRLLTVIERVLADSRNPLTN